MVFWYLWENAAQITPWPCQSNWIKLQKSQRFYFGLSWVSSLVLIYRNHKVLFFALVYMNHKGFWYFFFLYHSFPCLIFRQCESKLELGSTVLVSQHMHCITYDEMAVTWSSLRYHRLCPNPNPTGINRGLPGRTNWVLQICIVGNCPLMNHAAWHAQ